MKIIEKTLWIAAIMLLPFSSSPLIAKLLGVQSVAAPSLILFLLLLLIWLIPYLLRGGRIPRAATPFLIFIAVAGIASLLSSFYNIPTFRQTPGLRTMLSDLTTLTIGASIYIVASSWAGSMDDLKFLLKWINWSAVPLVLWCLLQAYYAFVVGEYPAWMVSAQEKFTASGLLYFRRLTGFAYEPSWLAHQLNMLYLPIWVSAALTGFTAHKWRAGFLTLERAMLPVGLILMFLSFSRIGWLTTLAVAGYLILVATILLYNRKIESLLTLFHSSAAKIAAKVIVPIVVAVLFVVIVGGLLYGAGLLMTKLDPRMAALFDIQSLKEQGPFMFANRLIFAERLVTWQATLGVFNDFPVLGVGIGNTGFFFPQKLSDIGYGLTETTRSLFHASDIPNTKSLWIRILGETGIVGFSIFVAWLFLLWTLARKLARSSNSMVRMISWLGQIAPVAFAVETFSLDSYALPYYWVTLGLVTASVTIMLRKKAPEELSKNELSA